MRLAQQFLLDQLIEHALEQYFGRDLIVLRRQGGAHRQHVSQSDIRTADGGHHRIGTRRVLREGLRAKGKPGDKGRGRKQGAKHEIILC